MAPRKKAEPQGILRLVDKTVEFIDCRNEASRTGILKSVDLLGWVGIEVEGRILYFHGSKLDAITEKIEQ